MWVLIKDIYFNSDVYTQSASFPNQVCNVMVPRVYAENVNQLKKDKRKKNQNNAMVNKQKETRKSKPNYNHVSITYDKDS